MVPIRQRDVFVRACIVGLASAGLGLALALAGLKVWGFYVAAAVLAPSVRWATVPLADARLDRSRSAKTALDFGGRAPDVRRAIGMLQVLLAGDQALVIDGMRRALEASEDIKVVGEAHSREELLALVARSSAAAVLLDLDMKGMRDLSGVRELTERLPQVKIAVISASEDREMIDTALLAGASAYMLKSVNAVDIPSVLRQATAGAQYHAVPVPTLREPVPVPPELTARETKVVRAIADGLTTKEISEAMWLSQGTVKFYLMNVYRKLGIATRRAEAPRAFDLGLVELGARRGES